MDFLPINPVKQIESLFNHCILKFVKGFTYRKKNSVILTKIPQIGVIFYLQYSLRFYNGDQSKQLYKTDQWLAIGQKMYKGQLTTIIFMNLRTNQIKKYKYQKTKTTHISISKNGRYLCSVGRSSQNKQQIFIIDASVSYDDYSGKIIYQNQITNNNQQIVDVVFSHHDQNLLSILHKNKFVIFKIKNQQQQTYFQSNIAKSNKVRQFTQMVFDPWDKLCYVASKNGDISQISVEKMKQVRIGPRKRVITAGIKHIKYVNPDRLVIIGVKGFIALLEVKQLKILKQATLNQQIINLTQFEGNLGFISTQKANIYILDGSNLNVKSFFTCHNSQINQICFVENNNDVFGTCGGSTIYLWNTITMQPILKIQLLQKQCLCLNLPRDGKFIIAGWNDDCIRFYSPTTGKMLKKLSNVHSGKVTAMISNITSDRLITGADNGSVRIWRIQEQYMGLLADSFSVNSQIHYFEIKQDNLAFCTEDGNYYIWNIKKSQKVVQHRANNFLKQIHVLDLYTVITVGSGPFLWKLRKNDGSVKEKKYIGGSYLNTFDYINKENKRIYFLGGQSGKLILHQEYYEEKDDSKNYQFDTFSQVTTIKISPDKSKIIVGTQKGFLLSFDINNIYN